MSFQVPDKLNLKRRKLIVVPTCVREGALPRTQTISLNPDISGGLTIGYTRTALTLTRHPHEIVIPTIRHLAKSSSQPNRHPHESGDP